MFNLYSSTKQHGFIEMLRNRSEAITAIQDAVEAVNAKNLDGVTNESRIAIIDVVKQSVFDRSVITDSFSSLNDFKIYVEFCFPKFESGVASIETRVVWKNGRWEIDPNW